LEFLSHTFPSSWSIMTIKKVLWVSLQLLFSIAPNIILTNSLTESYLPVIIESASDSWLTQVKIYYSYMYIRARTSYFPSDDDEVCFVLDQHLNGGRWWVQDPDSAVDDGLSSDPVKPKTIKLLLAASTLSTKHYEVRPKTWSAQNQDNCVSGVRCLPADCCN
jgi:hypothetical protein